VIARVFEEVGLITTGIVLVEEHAQRVKPPRMLAVPFNFGKALGEPGDPQYQHNVLRSTFALLDRAHGPVLEQYESNVAPEGVIQASETSNSSLEQGLKASDELMSAREHYEKWLSSNGGRTAVGLSTIPWQDFQKIITFLEGFINGELSDMKERPAESSVPEFIRCCAHDLKAFCYEGRMAQHTGGPDSELNKWFWSETAVGSLLMRLAERMRGDDDEEMSSMARGIAR